MADRYNVGSSGLTGSATRSASVSPNDSTDLTNVTRALWVGGAGNVAVMLLDDSAAVTFVGVAAGTLLPLRVRRVMSTNTTATNIVAVD